MQRLLSLFLVFVCVSVQASDLAKEQRWADQVVDSILDGDAEWLEISDHKFLSIYTEAEDESTRGLIVMHGTGVHPNWAQVIQPIRVEMTTRGWHTLSIQMPVLRNEAAHEEYAPLFPEVIPRIDSAIDYFKSQGIDEVVLVAHSLGSLMTSYYLANKPNQTIKGFIAIGMPGDSTHDAMNSLINLESIRVPVLDLYGSADLADVLAATEGKKMSASATQFSQFKVEGANHFFDDYEDELVEAVSNWLEQNF